jgi:hypothetical protein
MCDYRRGLDWRSDLLTSYVATITLLLISTLYRISDTCKYRKAVEVRGDSATQYGEPEKVLSGLGSKMEVQNSNTQAIVSL